MEEIKVEEIINYLNRECNGNVSIKDFNNGSGVYGIYLGSGSEVEEIFKVENFKLKSKEELIDYILDGDDSGEGRKEYLEEFCYSGEVEFSNNGFVYNGVIEVFSEEESIEYYNVVV